MDSNVPSSLATIIFSLTAALEFDGMLRVDVVESQAYLALYSHIRFMLCSHVPINSAEDGNAAKATRAHRLRTHFHRGGGHGSWSWHSSVNGRSFGTPGCSDDDEECRDIRCIARHRRISDVSARKLMV